MFIRFSVSDLPCFMRAPIDTRPDIVIVEIGPVAVLHYMVDEYQNPYGLC